MKRFYSVLAAMSLTFGSTAAVVACSTGLDLSLNYTDEEKIMAIYNLTQAELEENGVGIKSLMSSGDINFVVNALGLDDLITNNTSGSLIKKSLGVYIMSNQFLNEISAKVPGYGWIANKLTWQSQWGIKDLVKKASSEALFNNTSGWMKDIDNQWSLSVTFLDEQKIGWNGLKPPVYARININRKLVADVYGSVQVDSSNAEGVYGDDTIAPNVQDSLVDPNDPDKGVIYQGYANSSSLFKLENILSEDASKIPVGFFNYSPSATDFVNNKIINLDFGNMVLQNSEDEIEQTLNSYLTTNPIYLGEGMSKDQIEVVIKNQIYSVMLTNAINRNELVDASGAPLFTDDELVDAYIQIQAMITALEGIVATLNTYTWTDKTLLSEFTTMISSIKADDFIFSSVDRDGFAAKFREVAEDTRNKTDATAGQLPLFTGYLNSIFYKNIEDTDIALTDATLYTDFGFDATYKFKVYYWSVITPVTGGDNQWYNPDETNTDTENYISDKGFRNVYLSHRLNSGDDTNYNALGKYLSKQTNSALALDIFGFDYSNPSPNSSDVETAMLAKLKEAIALDGNQNSSTATHSSWRIYHLMALINQSANAKISDIFGYDLSGNLELHNKGVSLDYSNGTLPSDRGNADDDIAFAALVASGNINIVTNDFQSLASTEARENLFSNGIYGMVDVRYNQYLFTGTVNIFGTRLDSDTEVANKGKWWNSTTRRNGSFPYYITTPSSTWTSLLNDYWNTYVRQNSNNPDYNKNAN